jgi:DNA-binding winged helix-turn-helix (wHTH) protein
MSDRLAFGSFMLEPANALLLRDGARVDITPKAFGVLVLLTRRAGQLVTKDEILDEVWGRRFVSESVVKTVVSEVRSVLDDDARAPRWVETAARRGYRFIGKTAAVGVAPAAAAAVPAPLELNAQPCIIERTPALSVLKRAWTDACSGARRLVFITGDPGIGKSTLLNQFARQLDGASLALGQCVESYGSTEPYLPVLEALNARCNDDPTVIEVVRQAAPTWLVQMPWHLTEADRGALQRDVAGASQDRMIREMGVLLEQLTARAPLLLVLEDLHWSDPSTVQLLDHLARRRAAARLLVLATFRLTDIFVTGHPLVSLRQELKVHRLCEELHLDGFSADQVGRFVAARFDGTVPDETLVGALERHTDGLPLFLNAVLDELVEQGVIRRNGAWHFPKDPLRLPVPENLLGLAEKQMQRLPADVLRLLETASLVASDFDHLSIATALGLNANEVREQFDVLVRRKLWLRDTEPRTMHDDRLAMRYSFLHALFRHAFMRRLSEGSRIELHRKLGLALEHTYGPRAGEIASELAQHAEEGREAARAGRWYAVAARLAMQRIVPHEALALADRGLVQLGKLSTAPPDVELPLLSIRIGALMVTQGYSVPTLAPSIERATRLIESLPLSPPVVPLWHAMWWTLNNGGTWNRGRALARRFVDLAVGKGNAAAEAAALNTIGMDTLFSNQFQDAFGPLRQSLDVQQRFTEEDQRVPFIQDLRVEALANLCVALEACGRFEEAARARDDIEQRIRDGVDPLSEAMGLWYMSCCAQLRRDLPAMLEYGERAMQLMSTRAALPGAGPHRVARGYARVFSGDVSGLAEISSGIEHYRRQGSEMGVLFQRVSQAEACIEGGDLATAREALDVAFAQVASTEFCFMRPLAYRARAAFRLARGEPVTESLADLDAGIIDARASGAYLIELTLLADFLRTAPASDHAKSSRTRLKDVLVQLGPHDNPNVLAARRELASAEHS